MLGIGDSTGLCLAHGPRSRGSPCELATLAGDSGSVKGVKFACEPDIGLFKDIKEPLESLLYGRGIEDADEGSVGAGSGALVGVVCGMRHRFLVKSSTSIASMDTNAAAYCSRLILDSVTIYSAKSCKRSLSDVQLLSLRTNS